MVTCGGVRRVPPTRTVHYNNIRQFELQIKKEIFLYCTGSFFMPALADLRVLQWRKKEWSEIDITIWKKREWICQDSISPASAPHRPTNGQSRKTNFNSPKTTEIDQQRNKATSTYQLTTPISQPPIVPNFHHVKPRSKKSESLKHIFRSHCLLILKYPPSHIYLPINSNVISFKKISIGAKDQTRKRIERMEAEREERRRLMQEVSIALKKLWTNAPWLNAPFTP